MASINNTPRPAYVYDTATNEWIPIGVGAHSHNEIPKTVVDAKGDLIVGTAADEVNRLAVGSNGYTLVADSSQTTGLNYAPTFFAGKNKIINSDFNVNQRSFTSTTTDGTYGFDRWRMNGATGTVTYSAQTFTAGTAPVAGYEGTNFARIVTASQSGTNAYAMLCQPIEDVRTLANQTITISFWAKAASGTPKIAAVANQVFGTGGSTQVITGGSTQATISTSWARYSINVVNPSISGKTIGTGSNLRIDLWVSAGGDFDARTGSIGIQNNTFDIWGVQVEAGSTATQFQTATGTIQGELAACQRYYWRFTGPNAYSTYGIGYYTSTTAGFIDMPFPVPMRANTTSVDYANLAVQDTGGITALTALTIDQNSLKGASLALTVAAGGTANRPVRLLNNNNAAGYIGINAEL